MYASSIAVTSSPSASPSVSSSASSSASPSLEYTRHTQPQLQLQPQPHRPPSSYYPHLYPYPYLPPHHPPIGSDYQHTPHPSHPPYYPAINSTYHHQHHNPSIGWDYQHPVHHPHNPLNLEFGSTQPHHSPIGSNYPPPPYYPYYPQPLHPPHNPEIGSTQPHQYHYSKNQPKDSLVVASIAIKRDRSSSSTSESTLDSTTESTSMSNETDSQTHDGDINEGIVTTTNNTSVLPHPKKKQKINKKKNEKSKPLHLKAALNLKKTITHIDSLPMPQISSDVYNTRAPKDSVASISLDKYLNNIREGFINKNKQWNKGVGKHHGVIDLSMTEMGEFSIAWGYISRDGTKTLCSLPELANILDNEAGKFIQTKHFKEMMNQCLAKVSTMLSIVGDPTTIKEDHDLFYEPFKTAHINYNSSMANESMRPVGDQMICLVSSLGIRLVANQLYADTMITTYDRRLCQRSLQSAQNAKPNQVTLVFDFPRMPYAVRKILREILNDTFTEEEIEEGWYNPESHVVKVRNQVVKIMGQTMEEHWANPDGPFKDVYKKLIALWADPNSNLRKRKSRFWKEHETAAQQISTFLADPNCSYRKIPKKVWSNNDYLKTIFGGNLPEKENDVIIASGIQTTYNQWEGNRAFLIIRSVVQFLILHSTKERKSFLQLWIKLKKMMVDL